MFDYMYYFFFKDTAATEIYTYGHTLSLHDALPICVVNAQFRRAEDGRWLLLEINARPAGGVVYADQVGCSLIADWAGLLTGRSTPDTIDRSEVDTEVAFSTVVRPVAA